MVDSVHQTWESVAQAWEENRDYIFAQTKDISDAMLAHLDPQPGQTVLELASGPGETGFEIAARIAPGTLIQTDISASMVDAARRGADARGLKNVEHRVLDAQAMDLPDDAVDAISCRFGFMLMPDQQAAFAECARVLRPSGKLVFAVWGPAERNLAIVALALPVVQAGKAPVGDPNAPGGIFSLASEDRIRDVLGASFADVVVKEVQSESEIEDFDGWWQRQAAIAGPLAEAIRAASPSEQEGMRAGTKALFEQWRDGDRYRVTSSALVVSARAV